MSAAPWLVASLLAVSALGVARTQPRLARIVHDAKEQSDVYALPPPAQLKLFALGYDAATVDLLWAKMLVAYGTHWHEKREFHADPYLDAILEIEPSYGPAYRFADTLLCYRPLHATEADARKTRAILERGTRERPGDYMVWVEYGQFSVFLGPGYLTSADEAEKDRWRREGALALTRAVDLGAGTDTAVIAATILGQTGEREAAIASLERSYAYTDDPDRRADISRKLMRLDAMAESDKRERSLNLLESLWKRDWSFLTRDQYVLLAPMPDAARCAGPPSADDPACARDWETVLRDQPAP
jgi:hypothetical protein